MPPLHQASRPLPQKRQSHSRNPDKATNRPLQDAIRHQRAVRRERSPPRDSRNSFADHGPPPLKVCHQHLHLRDTRTAMWDDKHLEEKSCSFPTQPCRPAVVARKPSNRHHHRCSCRREASQTSQQASWTTRTGKRLWTFLQKTLQTATPMVCP